MTTFVPAIVVAAILILGLYLASRRKSGQPKEDVPPTIARIRENVRAILRKNYPNATVSSYGSTELDPRPFTVTVLLATDLERDRFEADADFGERFRQALVDADYPAASIPQVKLLAESQQTVDRGNRDHARG